LMPLYRRAGILYVLMGIETTSEDVIRQIKKGSSTRHDFLASRLLKEHGIFSILGQIVGLENETRQGFRAALEQLLSYDGAWLNAMYATPHSWTPFYQAMREQRIVQLDRRKWDYRHQIFAQKYLKPWQLFFSVKWLEFRFHIRFSRLWEAWREPDPFRRRQIWWCYVHTGVVWLGEIAEFVLFTRHAAQPPRLATVERESEALPDGLSKEVEAEAEALAV
jgi:anaerobic magnesium-protoporphyrin IX monomethyl ester cyclase